MLFCFPPCFFVYIWLVWFLISATHWGGPVVGPPVLPLRFPRHLCHFQVRGCVPDRNGHTLLHLAARLILIIMREAVVLCCRAIMCCSVLPVPVCVHCSGGWWLKKLGRTGGKPVHGVMLFYTSQLLTYLYSMKIKQWNNDLQDFFKKHFIKWQKLFLGFKTPQLWVTQQCRSLTPPPTSARGRHISASF